MKTTIELSDSIYTQAKARAEMEGKTIDEFLADTIRDKIAEEEDAHERGLMAVFGKADSAEVAEVQRIIDEEFSKIDPEDWK